MANVRLDVEVPQELVELLGRSSLSARSRSVQVRVALAIHLFLTAEVSFARAAELAGESRGDFEQLLVDLGLPLVVYGREEYEQDDRSLSALEREPPNGNDRR